MNFDLKQSWKKYLVIIVVLPVLFFFRPWFHGPFMLFYMNPVIIEIGVVWFLVNKFVLSRMGGEFVIGNRDEKTKVPITWAVSTPLLIILVMLGVWFSVLMPQVHLANELEFTKIAELPETKENLRLMPYDVAYRYAKDSLQLSQYKLGTQNMVVADGKLNWVFPLIPDGFFLQFMIENKGVVFVDATTQEKNTNIVWKDLAIGEGMQIFNNLWWNLYNNRYLVNYDDPFYLTYNNEVYTVVSSVSYSHHSWYGLLYAVPRFDGVTLIDSGGNTQFLTPEETLNSPILRNNRIFPENLTRYYTESYVYHKGIINAFFIHEDQIDIQDVKGANRQPFLMDTAQGLKWFISTEPFGESHGVFKIFLVDAQTGAIEMYELPAEETLTGPIKAMDFVRRSNPIVDWSMFKLAEPLPFIENNLLFWKVVVIPYDAAGIAYQAFVNSKTNEVIELTTNSEIEEFIKTGTMTPKEPEEETAETKEGIIKEIEKKIQEIKELLEQIKED